MNARQWQGLDDKATFEAMFSTLAMPVLKQIVAAEAHARSPTAVLVSRLGATALAARSDMCFDAFLDGASWYVLLPALTPHGLTTPYPTSFLDRLSCMSPATSIAAEDTVQLQNCLRTVALVAAQAKAKVRGLFFPVHTARCACLTRHARARTLSRLHVSKSRWQHWRH